MVEAISQIHINYNVKNEDPGEFFPELGHISTFFEIGGIYTFSHFGTLKNGQNR